MEEKKRMQRGNLFYQCTWCGTMMEIPDLSTVVTCPNCGTPDDFWNSEED